MQINSIYLYPNKLDVYTSDNTASWTPERFRMVYNRNLKVYRGSDNRIDLQLRNSDQKAFNATGSTIVFNLVGRETQDLVLRKDCSIDDITVGRVYVTITEDEFLDIEPGYYSYSFHKETRTNIDSTDYKVTSKLPLFMDSQYGAIGTMEVIGGMEGKPYDTKTVDTFRKITNFDVPSIKDENVAPLQSPRPNFSQNYNTSGYEEFYISSHIDANPRMSTPQSLHTFQFYYNNYIGDVILQGSLGEGANPIEGSWTNINTFTITAANSNEFYNVTGKYNWFRIKHTPDKNNTGTVDKVLYR
jgi:hypothetical protein